MVRPKKFKSAAEAREAKRQYHREYYQKRKEELKKYQKDYNRKYKKSTRNQIKFADPKYLKMIPKRSYHHGELQHAQPEQFARMVNKILTGEMGIV